MTNWPATKPDIRAVATLKPHKNNARTHSPAQVAQLVESIREWGWTNPILVDDDDSIIAGHGRLLAAQALGLDQVPVVVADGWTDAQKRAYMLADNQLALNAGWDLAMLKGEVQSLAGWDFDLSLLGFDNLDELLAGEPEPGKTEPDEVPPVPKRPVTRRGDVWTLGAHRLMCGDSTDTEDVATVMDGKRAGLFATDPPYLVDYTGNNRPIKGKDWGETYREVDAEDAVPFFEALFKNALAVCDDDAAWYCWHAHKRYATITRIWQELDVLDHQQIIWVKPTLLPGYAFYSWQHEPCIMGWKQGHKPPHTAETHKIASVWPIDWEGKKRVGKAEHPTQKPVEIFRIPMRVHTRKGEICFEPFSGSGSQIIAGEMEARRVFALELEPLFVDVAVKRWELFTGKAATLGGKTFAEVQEARHKKKAPAERAGAEVPA